MKCVVCEVTDIQDRTEGCEEVSLVVPGMAIVQVHALWGRSSREADVSGVEWARAWDTARLGRPYTSCQDRLLHKVRGPSGALGRGGARSERIPMAAFNLSEPCAPNFLDLVEPEVR